MGDFKLLFFKPNIEDKIEFEIHETPKHTSKSFITVFELTRERLRSGMYTQMCGEVTRCYHPITNWTAGRSLTS